jgi:hypothetical protein
MTKETASRRIAIIPSAIKATEENLKLVLKRNAERGEEWNDQKCIDAHEGQINAMKKELKQAIAALA